MSEQQDREAMVSIFLLEAWDTLAVLEEALSRPPDDGGGAAAESLFIVTHRLQGSAALYGFPGLASLAGAAEALLERTPDALGDPQGEPGALFREMIGLMKVQLEAIQRCGSEEPDAVTTFLAQRGLPGAAAAPAAAGLLPPAAAAPGRGAGRPAPAGLVEELDGFFRQNPDVLEYFGPEAAEHLETMTASLLDMEQSGASPAGLATLFRAAHTLKGAAYTVGCRAVGDLAHRIEDLLALAREGRVPFSPEFVDAGLAGIDALRLMLGMGGERSAELAGSVERAVAALQALIPAPEPQAADGATLSLPEPERVAPAEALPRKTPEKDAEGEKRQARTRIRVDLGRLDSLMALVGELVIARSRLDQRLVQLARVGEALHFNCARVGQAVGEFERKNLYRLVSTPAPKEQAPAAEAAEVLSLAGTFEELEFDRYDDFNILARSMGEFSADLAELQEQTAGLIRAIRSDTGQIQQLTGQLRNEVTRTRMVPIGTLFARFSRQVREAAKAAGRTVTLETSGESVEVDTRVIEQLADPLLHLVRNAIAHGIEEEAERRAYCKPPHGTLALRASHRGGFVYVEVEDDGRGIDAESVKEQAAEQGLLPREAARALSQGDALNLIFLPGFSTAGRVTADSGRGVGMDVVRTNISRLNGEVQVETEVGVGTRFTLKLPLTVLISDALMTRVGGEVLAVPLNAVQRILSIARDGIQAVGRSEMIEVEGQRLELLSMDRLLGLPASERGGKLPVLVLRSGGKTFAVHVDELLGKEEVVIKPLGDFLADVGPFAGATISGEGRVILLVDPSRLLERSEQGPGSPDAPTRLPAEPRQLGPAGRVDGARRILLVDDSISVRKFVGAMLEKAGFEVITAVDGAEAIERVRETPVHLVVTDLEMPRINGYELIEHLRRHPATQAVPVVVLTTRAGEKHVNLARRLGVQHYVTKPVDDRAFVQLIHSIGTPAEAAALPDGRVS